MEPVTHVLTGACLARAGFNRRAAYATFAMVLAAELPDIDSLWAFRGPIEVFKHHRGITHTFLGVPFEAAFVVLIVYAVHRWREARVAKRPKPAPVGDHVRVERPLTAAPLRWGLLYGFSILALLSHLLLDYTNNYGLRPFYPFNPHWYAASIVFIFDPIIFVLLLMGLLVPLLFRLVSAEVGSRRQPFTATGWPIVALFFIVVLWGVRWIEHDRAIQLATAQSLAAPPPPQSETSSGAATSQQPNQALLPRYLSAEGALANPDVLSIFRELLVAPPIRNRSQQRYQGSRCGENYTLADSLLNQRWVLFLRRRNIRSRRNELQTGAHNLFPVELRSSDDDVMAPRLQLHRQGHVGMNIPVRADGCQHDSFAHMLSAAPSAPPALAVPLLLPSARS